MNSRYDALTFQDITDVSQRLESVAGAYRSLAVRSVESFYFNLNRETLPEDRYATTTPGEAGIDVEALFAGKREFAFSLPSHFGIGDLTYPLLDDLAGAMFIAAPKAALCSGDDIYIPVGGKVPRGHRLTGNMALKPGNEYSWVRFYEILIEYYAAAVEPLLRQPMIAPLLDGCGSLVLLICDRQRYGEPGLSKDELLKSYGAIFRKFELDLAALRREAIRRIPTGEEIAHSAGGGARSRMNRRDRKAMLKAILELSSETNDKLTAKGVHDRMREIDPGTTSEFDAARLSHGKKELMNDYPQLKFSRKSSYRVTPESIAQLGHPKKKQERKHCLKTR